MWQLSIRSKIIPTLLLTGLACLAAGAIIGYRAGEKALTRSVVADLDTDVLAIPAQALVEAMDNSRLIARDIIAVTEARRQAIMPLNRELRVVA